MILKIIFWYMFSVCDVLRVIWSHWKYVRTVPMSNQGHSTQLDCLGPTLQRVWCSWRKNRNAPCWMWRSQSNRNVKETWRGIQTTEDKTEGPDDHKLSLLLLHYGSCLFTLNSHLIQKNFERFSVWHLNIHEEIHLCALSYICHVAANYTLCDQACLYLWNIK